MNFSDLRGRVNGEVLGSRWRNIKDTVIKNLHKNEADLTTYAKKQIKSISFCLPYLKKQPISPL